MTWYRGLESFVRPGVSLAPLTSYRVGGPAEYFAEPPGEEALGMVLRRAHEEAIPVNLLGHGTNLLVGDRGVKGLVLRLPKQGFAELREDGTRLHVGAGHSLPGLVKWSVARNRGGLACLVGVPGTVGAALRMNAGGKYGEIGARVRGVWGFAMDGTRFAYDRAHCGFQYRDSGLKGRIVTRCELEIEDDRDPCAERLDARQVLEEKRATQPLAARSAGCVFKNPKRPGVAPAGKLIDDLGLKGRRIGAAEVSTRHANFLVTHPGATAADLAALIRLIRTRVLRERGVWLDLEIAAWGLSDEELGAA